MPATAQRGFWGKIILFNMVNMKEIIYFQILNLPVIFVQFSNQTISL
jgi:hypothetical protein